MFLWFECDPVMLEDSIEPLEGEATVKEVHPWGNEV